MKFRIRRRQFLQTMAAAGLVSMPGRAAALTTQAPTFQGMPPEGKDTPKICLGFYGHARRGGHAPREQIGVDYVLTGGPEDPGPRPTSAAASRVQGRRPGPLQHDHLRVQRCHLGTTRRGRADRGCHRVHPGAGKAGLPVIEYNFYAHRLAEGYKEEIGGRARDTQRTTMRSKYLPPKDGGGRTRAPSN